MEMYIDKPYKEYNKIMMPVKDFNHLVLILGYVFQVTEVCSLLLLILAPSYCSRQVIQSLLVTYKMMQLHAFHNSGNSQFFIIEISSSVIQYEYRVYVQ